MIGTGLTVGIISVVLGNPALTLFSEKDPGSMRAALLVTMADEDLEGVHRAEDYIPIFQNREEV